MKKVFLLTYLLLVGANVFAQEVYCIDDFIENHTLYYAIEKASGEDEADNEAYILYDKNKKTVLEANDTPLKSYLLNNRSKATPVKYNDLPEINIRLVDDFNFDGIRDITIDDTEILDDGCYNPQKNSNIYLSIDNWFDFSSSLSSIYNETSCYRNGSVSLNNETKTVSACNGAGTYYDVNIYKIDGLECKLIAKYVENAAVNPVFVEVEGSELKNGKWEDVKLKDVYLEEDDKNILLSFNADNKKGNILLFKRDDVLYYAFKRAENNNYISFAYPSHPDKAQKSKFNFENNSEKYTLEFNSGAVKYVIYESANSLGIKIYVDGKLSDWAADLSSKKGSLKQLVDTELQNLTKQ